MSKSEPVSDIPLRMRVGGIMQRVTGLQVKCWAVVGVRTALAYLDYRERALRDSRCSGKIWMTACEERRRNVQMLFVAVFFFSTLIRVSRTLGILCADQHFCSSAQSFWGWLRGHVDIFTFPLIWFWSQSLMASNGMASKGFSTHYLRILEGKSLKKESLCNLIKLMLWKMSKKL